MLRCDDNPNHLFPMHIQAYGAGGEAFKVQHRLTKKRCLSAAQESQAFPPPRPSQSVLRMQYLPSAASQNFRWLEHVAVSSLLMKELS